ncbi:MAG TPA: M20/M25/M40 family metallo-hydrolase, partial [Bacteroidia bacterium]|nr:M20/M25/M40 family metallo-hydrolase [Bacteroidia bacterium]
AATAEEEISGKNGIELLFPHLGKIDAAIVGEPTQMKMAVAEKGLLVLDCFAHGKSGHAARQEGDNAIRKAWKDVAWFMDFRFPEISPWLGSTQMNVTMISAGTQHNVVPDKCSFTVDVRVTECYTPEDVLKTVRENVSCEVVPRSLRLRPSFIAEDHPLVRAGKTSGLSAFGSPTLSDCALIPVPCIKIGPGDSVRSHTAGEFIFLTEIEHGIAAYVQLLENFGAAIGKKPTELSHHS